MMTCDRYYLVGIVGTLLAALLCPPVVAQTSDPHKLIAEADRLACHSQQERDKQAADSAQPGSTRSGRAHAEARG